FGSPGTPPPAPAQGQGPGAGGPHPPSAPSAGTGTTHAPPPPGFPNPPHAPQGSQGPQVSPGPQEPHAPRFPDSPAFPDSSGFPNPSGFPEASRFPDAPATWTAVVAPDRSYFLAMMQRSGPEASGLNLPAYSPEQRLVLTGNQISIGRRRHSTGESPDIDLSVPPEDPGVSHQHAVLVSQPNGTWAVVDQGSTNGTTLNGGEDPIQPYVPVPLKDGDRVHVGAWTTITIVRG
ncbi:FHA domain-containing protein, partial [Streptomyces sp. NPDC047097]|uniref:FHA domain-containing protein n=1 Tax=Streptomyces sp. NPDC047097 TaxID=3155260 RepID=UPI0033FA49CA